MMLFSNRDFIPWKIIQIGVVGDMDESVVKNGVHAAAYQACAPKLGSLKQKCSGKHFDA